MEADSQAIFDLLLVMSHFFAVMMGFAKGGQR